MNAPSARMYPLASLSNEREVPVFEMMPSWLKPMDPTSWPR